MNLSTAPPAIGGAGKKGPKASVIRISANFESIIQKRHDGRSVAGAYEIAALLTAGNASKYQVVNLVAGNPT